MLGLKQYCIFITLVLCVSASHATDFAENLYTGYKEVLYQIKIINNESGQKSTIGSGFIINGQLPTQGSTIYSLGNPHDLGMIVVPGTYNGLKQNSLYQKIHFTGSVNSGMSGGPLVNEGGEAMGVNVATAGNQLGFLVPLNNLYQ